MATTTITRSIGGVRIMEGTKLLADIIGRPDSIKPKGSTVLIKIGSDEYQVSTANLDIDTGTGSASTFSGTATELSLKLMNEVFFLDINNGFGTSNFQLLQANGGGASSLTQIGLSSANTGTATGRANTATLFGQKKRLGYVSAGTAGQTAGVRQSQANLWRGNAAGLGGFEIVFRFGLSSAVVNAGYRGAVGLASSTSVFATGNPSALTNVILMAFDDTDTNFQIMHNDGSGTCTKVDLGSSFPANTTSLDWYELRISCNPNDSVFRYNVINYKTGAVASGTLSTNLPANTTFFSWHVWTDNAAVAAAVGIDIGYVFAKPKY